MEFLEAYHDALCYTLSLVWCPSFGWRIFDYGALHLEDDDMETLMMEAWLWWWSGCFDWWLWGFALMMTWCFGWWRFGLVDVLVDGGFGTLMIWRYFLFYNLPVRWSLPHLRVGFLKPLLVGSKRTLAGSSKRIGTLISVGAEWSEKIEVFHITTLLYQMVFINE